MLKRSKGEAAVDLDLRGKLNRVIGVGTGERGWRLGRDREEMRV